MTFREFLAAEESMTGKTGRAAESPVKPAQVTAGPSTFSPRGSENTPKGWKPKSPPGVNRPTPGSHQFGKGISGIGKGLAAVLPGGNFGGGAVQKMQIPITQFNGIVPPISVMRK